MRRVLIAPDKLRGTATAVEAARALAAGARRAGWQTVEFPLADGGEGMLDAFGGPNRRTEATGPQGTSVEVPWRLDDVAVIESSLVAGLELAGGAERNDPWAATTRGVGELIAAATEAGAQTILIGLGGSATTDGGLGAVQALQADPRWRDVPLVERPRLVACCDVTTRFLDAPSVFGPQKGADAALVVALEERLREVAEFYRCEFGVDVEETPGTGAAGGLGGGLLALGADLVSGFEAVATARGLDAELAACDAVITAEGRLDPGSLDGKVVGSIVARARARGIERIGVVAGIAENVGAELEGVEIVDLTERYGADAALGSTLALLERAAAELAGAWN